MNGFWAALAVGTVLGVLAGLGTGGGSLLILWLTLALGMASQEARVINLLFFIPSALAACLFRWKQGRLDMKKVLPAIASGSISAAIFAFLREGLDTSLLQKLFGFLLILTGIRELSYKPKKR